MPEPEILKVPPAEAIAHFQAKGFHVGFDWRDTAAGEHVRSFTVAKAMSLDVLEDIRGVVDEALVEGTTFRQFHKRLEPLLRDKGWWGQKTIDGRVVQLGSRRRLRIIFDTNLRMSYARGRWERIERLAEEAPWLRYVAVQDERTRPDHAAWQDTILPWDHPFWRTHYPPNGWRCRCLVQQLSDDDLEAFGFTPSSGAPEGSERTRPWHDRRADRTVRVPVGIDPGFQHNVGLVGGGRDTADRLIAKMDAASPELARASVGTPWRTALFERHRSGALDGDWPVAVLPGGVQKALGGRSHTVRFSGETAAKQRVRHKDVVAEDYAGVQRILDEGELFEAGPRHATGFLDIGGRPWRAVLKVTSDRSEAYLVSFHKAQPYDLAGARQHKKRVDRGGE